MIPQLGVTVYSKTGRHADETSLPLGGIIIDLYADPDTGEKLVRTVTIYRGRPTYHTMPETDIDENASSGLVRRDVLKSFALHLTKDEVRTGDVFRHLHAKTVIAGVLAAAGDPTIAKAHR